MVRAECRRQGWPIRTPALRRVDVGCNLVYDQSPNTTSYYKGGRATSLKYATSGNWVGKSDEDA
jgi:hypothetical protein